MTSRTIDIQDYALDLEAEIRRAADALLAGELVILPTETVYGIAGKPSVESAATRLGELRGGSTTPLTPHLPGSESASLYIGEPSAMARRLMDKLWPGPVALMFDVDKRQRREAGKQLGLDPSLVFNAEGQVVLRCPSEPLAVAVLEAAGQPIVVTRAGLDGKEPNRAPAPGSAPEQVSMVLDAGPTRLTKPSTVVRVRGDAWEIVREGIYDRRIIERMLRTTILFVCSGNTCRSPMAAALARKLIAEHIGASPGELSDRGYEVVSAGTFAMPGMRATPQAAVAVEQMGGELASHRSQPVTVELINRADAIITMGEAHTQAILGLVPSAAARTLTLDPKGDVEDPIGSDAAHYLELASQLEQMVRRRLAETILKQG